MSHPEAHTIRAIEALAALAVEPHPKDVALLVAVQDIARQEGMEYAVLAAKEAREKIAESPREPAFAKRRNGLSTW